MSEQQTDEQARSIGKRANELNASIRYTMWSVFRLPTARGRPPGQRRRRGRDAVRRLADEDVVVRGVYDVAACGRTPT